MQFTHWKTESINTISPQEFYALIEKNRNHIRKTFPRTLASCRDLKATEKFFAEAADNEAWKDNYYFYLRNTDSKALIGYIVIKNIDVDIAKCELAYFIDNDFEGKGIITKAIGDTLNFCFGELKMNKVTICTSKENKASQRIAEKHGFIQEGLLKQEFKSGEGKLEDVLYFGLLKQDYQKNEK